jgi:hypothetical protein
MDRLFAPQWAGGWTATRWLYVLVGLIAHLPRVQWLEDAYADADFLYSRPPLSVPDWWILTPTSAAVIWAVSLIGLLTVAWGGRWAKAGLGLWLVGATLLVSHEGLNYKAYDRLHMWIGIAMLFAPVGERNLTQKARNPVGRWILLMVFCSLYGMTGWTKALTEPGWLTGEVLAYHLVDLQFGNRSLGLWASGYPALTRAMSWATLAYECSFVFLIWSRRTNPWLLLAGVGFHLGIMLTMSVGPFSYITLVAFPVLLHPEVAQRWWERWRAPTAA